MFKLFLFFVPNSMRIFFKLNPCQYNCSLSRPMFSPLHNRLCQAGWKKKKKQQVTLSSLTLLFTLFFLLPTHFMLFFLFLAFSPSFISFISVPSSILIPCSLFFFFYHASTAVSDEHISQGLLMKSLSFTITEKPPSLSVSGWGKRAE